MRWVVYNCHTHSPDDSLMIDDARADQLMNPQAVTVVAEVGQRLGKKCRIRQSLGGRAVVNAVEADEPLLLLLSTRLDNGEPPRPGQQTGAWRKAFDSIGDQRDVQFAVNPVGTTDAPDLA